MNSAVTVNAADTRVQIMRLQEALSKMPPAVMEKRHHFAQGIYARELHIPKGVCLVGRIHLQSQINIISKGDISVLTEKGVIRIVAPFTLITPAGAKRAGYAHEDTIWTTLLGTEETDPDVIYETLTAMDFEEYEAVCAARKYILIPGERHGV